jgi:glycosyltransferase involved in cell wall biosynthesis
VSNLVIDARMVKKGSQDSTSRYVTHLAEGLLQRSSKDELSYRSIFLVNEDLPQVYPWTKVLKQVVYTPFLSPFEWITLPRILKKLNAKAYHSPSISSLPWCPCPWVVTVHDLSLLKYGNFWNKLYCVFLLKPFIKRAHGVVTVSKTAQKEIADWAKIPEEQIRIANRVTDSSLAPQVSDFEKSKVLQKFELEPGKYFFALAGSEARGNASLLVRAYSGFRVKFFGSPVYPLVISLPEFTGVQGVKVTGALKREETQALLEGARAVFSPSLSEGLEQESLEAAVAGAPLVVSDILAHREMLSLFGEGEVTFIQAQKLEAWLNAFENAFLGDMVPISAETRNQILSNYSLDDLIIGMDQLYNAVLNVGDESEAPSLPNIQ